MTFRSKVDGWLVGLIVAIVGGAFVFVVTGIARDGGPKAAVIAAVLLAGVGLFIIRTFRSTRYEVDGATLTVRSNFLRWRIDITSIDDVTPTHDPISSPAMSLDRLRIRYRKDGEARELLVSPAEKEAFVEALRAVKPAIRYHRATHADP
jgi:hypothetical protein